MDEYFFVRVYDCSKSSKNFELMRALGLDTQVMVPRPDGHITQTGQEKINEKIQKLFPGFNTYEEVYQYYHNKYLGSIELV